MSCRNTAQFLLLVALSIWLASTQTVVSQDNASTAIRWELQQGESLVVELNQTTNVTTNIDTRSQQIGNEMLLVMQWNVESVSDDAFVIDQSISRIKLTVNAPGKTGIQITSIDTDSSETPKKFGAELLKQIQPLIGTTFKVRMNKRGQIEEVSVPKESMEAIRNAPSSMQIRQIITENGLKDLIGQSAIVFPDKELAPGERWSSKSKLQLADSAVTKTNQFKYAGTEEKEGSQFHVINVTTDVSLDESSSDTIEMFAGDGNIWFSPSSQTILRSQFSNKMKTHRDYREKTLVSTVTTSVRMKVVRN